MPLRVRVQNYQSIEDATLTIEGLTSITGTNNAGKSAFLRAIRGAFTNTRGASFVRLGASHATVEIEDLETGHVLVWEKGAKTNCYTINGKKYDRVGHGVPPEVQDLFGIQPIQVGGNALWPQIAPQMNGVMFLLDQPGSVVAEAVADVERVNQLNAALKLSESDRRSTKSDLKVRIRDGQVLQEHRQQFDGLDEVVASIRDLEAQKAKIEKLLQAHKNLVRLQTRLSAARQVTDSLRGVEKIFDVLPSDERVTKIQNFRQAIGVTVDLATRYESAKSEFEDTVKAQDALSAVRLDEEVESQVDRTYRVIHKTVKLRDALRKAEAQLEQIKQAIAQRENELSSIQQQVISLFGELKECPTCGGEVGQDHIHVS